MIINYKSNDTELVFKIVYILYSYIFLYRFLNDYIQNGSLSSLIYIMFEIALIVMVIIRKLPKEVTVKSSDCFYAIFGAILPLMIIPDYLASDSNYLLALQVIGVVISGLGLLSLNSSFGLIPANRGVKQNGFYRVIRHPMYCGYIISISAVVFQNLTQFNFLIFKLH